MASSDLTIEQIYNYFKENGNVVKNRELVKHFKAYLTDPASKHDARTKFKKYVNSLALTKTEDQEKYLILKTKHHNFLNVSKPEEDPRNAVGIPLSPASADYSPNSVVLRHPPPYRPPPPVTSPSLSYDNISLSSVMSFSEPPQPPPRRRSSDRMCDEDFITPKKVAAEGDDKQAVSVKERTEKFNRLASVEDELSPRQAKSAEKTSVRKGADEDDDASVTSLEPKKCMEWYVTAAKGDLQELVKLAKDEPRLVSRKDPFTAYTVLHWGAKHGNLDIIKTFAGTYKVNVNGKTNGGYTPLHLAAQFGHNEAYDLLCKVYKADPKIRDYSGRMPDFYRKNGQQVGRKDNIRKIKNRKKQSDKDLGFLRIGSLNVRVKKTTEAFSNFLGVGSGSINPLEHLEKIHKGWGSADNLNQENSVPGFKGNFAKKKSKRPYSTGLNSTPGTPTQQRTIRPNFTNESDSDSAAGFDCQWKN